MKILIVEHDPVTRARLVNMTKRTGFDSIEVVKARTKKEAVEALEKERYGMIVWGYALPDGPTLTLIELARKKFPEIPMLAISNDPGERRQQMDSGCNVGAAFFTAGKVFKEELRKLMPPA